MYSRRVMAVCFCLLVPLRSADAQDPPPNKDAQKVQAAEAAKLAKAESTHWEIFAGEDGQTKLTVLSEPVFRWTNPVTGTIHGDIYLWTANGRPEVAVSLHKWYGRLTHMTAEFSSLSRNPLRAKRDGQLAWYPAKPGVELKPVPDAPQPADSPIKRLRQMRSISEMFSAEASDRQRGDEVYQLRLQTKPIHRYESSDPDLLDGALFVYTQGTNPEVWLLIEAQRTDDGFHWQYGMAEMNSVRLRAYCRPPGQENPTLVWEIPQMSPPLSAVEDPRRGYFRRSVPWREILTTPESE